MTNQALGYVEHFLSETQLHYFERFDLSGVVNSGYVWSGNSLPLIINDQLSIVVQFR